MWKPSRELQTAQNLPWARFGRRLQVSLVQGVGDLRTDPPAALRVDQVHDARPEAVSNGTIGV
jgi:hypothetical protein